MSKPTRKSSKGPKPANILVGTSTKRQHLRTVPVVLLERGMNWEPGRVENKSGGGGGGGRENLYIHHQQLQPKQTAKTYRNKKTEARVRILYRAEGQTWISLLCPLMPKGH